MKHEFIEIERKLETPVENDVQRRLRAILEYWGPSGELHAVWTREDRNGARCIFGQIAYAKFRTVFGSEIDPYVLRCAELIACNQAAEEMGFAACINQPAVNCNNSGFPNARKMVLRAIELAGAP